MIGAVLNALIILVITPWWFARQHFLFSSFLPHPVWRPRVRGRRRWCWWRSLLPYRCVGFLPPSPCRCCRMWTFSMEMKIIEPSNQEWGKCHKVDARVCKQCIIFVRQRHVSVGHKVLNCFISSPHCVSFSQPLTLHDVTQFCLILHIAPVFP